MADGETSAGTTSAPRIGPPLERRLRRWLLGAFLATLALAALYGFHRGGAGGAAVGFVSGVWVASMFVFAGNRLIRWLAAPRKPPLWRFERLYWSVTIVIAAAILVGGVVLIGAFDPIEEHGVDGYVDGLIAGVISAGLFGFVAGRLHAWLMWLKGPEVADATDDPSRLQSALAPTLAELEAVRQDVGRRIRRRAAWMTPLGAGVLLAAWAIFVLRGGGLNLLAPPLAVLVGAAAGHIVASHRLAAEYERLYKARVLPRLAAQFGLSFGRAVPPDLERLRRFHVFRHFTAARAADAISGQYRGLQLTILQLQLLRGWIPPRKTVFRGVLIEIELKNRLLGTTAITADAGAFGNLRDELAARNIRRVGLESAAFERDYEVYATDQVMARALLTPDFMERFKALEHSAGFGRPLALAQDSTLLLAMPRADDRKAAWDFFDPPTFEEPASDDGVLQRLHDDIEAMLKATDSVIALDEATSQQAKSRSGRRKAAPAG